MCKQLPATIIHDIARSTRTAGVIARLAAEARLRGGMPSPEWQSELSTEVAKWSRRVGEHCREDLMQEGTATLLELLTQEPRLRFAPAPVRQEAMRYVIRGALRREAERLRSVAAELAMQARRAHA